MIGARVSRFATLWAGVLIAAAIAMAATGCGASAPAPEPEEATVTLAVTGGFAGVDWSVRLDGAAGQLRGERCEGRLACDWDRGEILATVPADRIRELLDEFARRGFLDAADRDFGSECCDQFDYRLSFVAGTRSRTVSGSDGTLPAEVLELIELVVRLIPTGSTASD